MTCMHRHAHRPSHLLTFCHLVPVVQGTVGVLGIWDHWRTHLKSLRGHEQQTANTHRGEGLMRTVAEGYMQDCPWNSLVGSCARFMLRVSSVCCVCVCEWVSCVCLFTHLR